MIVAEIALAVTLVAGAGWLVRSFTNLQSDDPGFSPEGRVIFDVLLPFARYQQPEQRSVWIRTLLGKLRAIEGVEVPAQRQACDAVPTTNPRRSFRSRDRPSVLALPAGEP